MKPIAKVLFVAAIVAAGFATGQTTVPDDEALPPNFDREAGYRRRYSALPVSNAPRPKYSAHLYDGKPSAKYPRSGEVIAIGVEEEFPIFKPTLVTLAMKDKPAKEAAAELGKAMGIKIKVMPLGYLVNDDTPAIALNLDRRPAMDALLQYASQIGARPSTDETGRLVLMEGESDRAVGTWCVAGPFAFIITRIERTIPLDRTDTFRSANSPMIRMLLIAEPRLKVLSYPRQFDVEIMQDELGNNLTDKLAPPYVTNMSSRRAIEEVYFPLKIPAGAGKRIKIFRASGKFTVQTESATAELAFGDKPQEKVISGMMFRVTPTTSPNPNQYTATVTLSRNEMPAARWNALTQMLPGVLPQFCDESGKPLPVSSTPQARITGDTYSIDLRVFLGSEMPAPAKVVMELPLASKDVVVPFVFRDLILP